MRHEPLIIAVIEPEMLEIAGVVEALTEILEIT
jgi:hypothetical protein